MELPSTIASWDGDRLTLWKDPVGAGHANSVARALGVPVGTTSGCFCPFLGGGVRQCGRTWPHQILAAYAARELGRPVKLGSPARQMYTASATVRPAASAWRWGAGTDGRLTALVHEAHHEASGTSRSGRDHRAAQVGLRAPHVRSRLPPGSRWTCPRPRSCAGLVR